MPNDVRFSDHDYEVRFGTYIERQNAPNVAFWDRAIVCFALAGSTVSTDTSAGSPLARELGASSSLPPDDACGSSARHSTSDERNGLMPTARTPHAPHAALAPHARHAQPVIVGGGGYLFREMKTRSRADGVVGSGRVRGQRDGAHDAVGFGEDFYAGLVEGAEVGAMRGLMATMSASTNSGHVIVGAKRRYWPKTCLHLTCTGERVSQQLLDEKRTTRETCNFSRVGVSDCEQSDYSTGNCSSAFQNCRIIAVAVARNA